MSRYTREEAEAILGDAAALVARLQADEEERERVAMLEAGARRAGWIPEAPLPPLPHRAEPEPVVTRSASAASAQRAAAAAYARRVSKPTMRKPKLPTFTRAQVDAIGQALAHERRGMRKHVEAELEELRREVAALRAEINVRGEIDELRQQIAVVRGGDRVLDLRKVGT